MTRASRRRHAASCLLMLAAMIATACVSVGVISVGGTPSLSVRGTGAFRAGFGRADITPPPVGGLMGYGPEGREAKGYRQRLYARAMLLEDARGERLAFVVADLGMISLALQRKVAGAIAARTQLGPDRLILSATHTHAGPGHYFAVRAFDDFGSSVAGFDPAMLEFLAERISRAVLAAADSMRVARAIWGVDTVWGQTRNRSQKAFASNVPPFRSRWPVPASLPEAYRKVDPSLTMLRVDQWDSTAMTFRPAGALSIFAMHGTGNGEWNELFDGDVHGVVSRVLERHVDSLNGVAGRAIPRALHLFANGPEGDVSPNFRRDVSRCPSPTPERGRRIRGPRSPRSPDVWVHPAAPYCLTNARRDVESVGTAVGARAIALFDHLGVLMSDDSRARAQRSLFIARAFEVATMIGGHETPGRCRTPATGTPTPVGTEDNVSRFLDWKLFGLIPLGFDTAGAPKSSGQCQSPKQPLLGPFQRLIGDAPLPEVAQLTVARVGGMLIGTTPGEVTTTAGSRIRAAMAETARRTGAHPDSVVLLGLANGYIYYVTTPEEYAIQHYEGSSTLYGRETATYLRDRLAALAGQLPSTGAPSPPAFVSPLQAKPGPIVRRFPPPDAGPPASAIRRSIEAHWSARHDTLVVTWNDLHPGRLLPADGLRLAILRRVGAQWDTVAWDDDANVEIWARGPRRNGYRWEARWALRPPVSRGAVYRVVLLPTKELPVVSTAEIFGAPP